MGTPTLKRVNGAVILENGLVPPSPILPEPLLDELDDILGEDEDSGNDSEDKGTLLNGTDFKLEWYYQQISTAVEYLSILATILGGGEGGGGRKNLPHK